MCDHDAMDVMQRAGELSRRQFGALGVGAGVIAMLPRAANAAEVSESEVTIKTPDGNCDAHFVHPKTGAACGRAGLAGHLRPARSVPADGQAAGRIRLLGAHRESLLPHAEGAHRAAESQLRRPGHARSADEARRRDSMPPRTSPTPRPSSNWLDAQAQVDKKKKIGTEGYCMGGPIVMRTAAAACRIASAPAPRSTAAASSPTSRTARTCSSRR